MAARPELVEAAHKAAQVQPWRRNAAFGRAVDGPSDVDKAVAATERWLAGIGYQVKSRNLLTAYVAIAITNLKFRLRGDMDRLYDLLAGTDDSGPVERLRVEALNRCAELIPETATDAGNTEGG